MFCGGDSVVRVLFFVVLTFLLFIGGCENTPTVATTIDQVEGVHLNLSEQELAFTFFSLESGEATLIQNGKGQNVLIDTGDAGTKEELKDRLSMYHVNTIDTLILTSSKNEYVGNLQWVIDAYQIKKVIVPSVIKEKIISTFRLPAEKVEGWAEGRQADLLPGLLTEVIYVEEDDIQNEGSLALSLTFGNQRTLYMSIANEGVEERLAEKYMLKSAILKVADFGSELGTSQLFLDEVDPQVAILFKAKSKRTSELVLERLQETWIDIYQTNRLGNISIKCNGEDYEILTVRSDGEGF